MKKAQVLFALLSIGILTYANEGNTGAGTPGKQPKIAPCGGTITVSSSATVDCNGTTVTITASNTQSYSSSTGSCSSAASAAAKTASTNATNVLASQVAAITASCESTAE